MSPGNNFGPPIPIAPSKAGGAFVLATALAYLSFGAGALLDPSITVFDVWGAFLAAPSPALGARISLTLAALFGLGAIPALEASLMHTRGSRPGRSAPIGPIRWLGQLASLGFFVLALANVQEMSSGMLFFRIDPNGWLWIGCIGLWALGTSARALRSDAWPKPTVAFGLALGSFYLGALACHVVATEKAFTIAVSVGSLVLAPLWLGSLGLFLLARTPSPAAGVSV